MTEDSKAISISVVIPAFNAQDHIERAVDSVLAQTSPADEIVVVDDGSTDRTAEKIRQYESRVQYLFQEHAGANEARNRGIRQASSEWVAFLDADDRWLPNKLERQRQLLARNPHLVWAYGNYFVVKPGMPQRNAHDPKMVDKLLHPDGYLEDFFRAYANGIPVHTITMVIKKCVLQEIGLFLTGQVIGHDPDVALRLAYRYDGVGYSEQPLAVHYFGRPAGITQQSKDQLEVRKQFILRHLELSAACGKQDRFQPCAEMLLTKWVREMLYEVSSQELVSFITQFHDLIPDSLRWEAWLRCRLPKPLQGLPDGYWFFKTLLRKLRQRLSLRRRYSPEKYWKNRHQQYGMDYRGVGNCTLSPEANEQMYAQARNIILRTCGRIGIEWKSARVLDIGCGNGFYTALFEECKVPSYTGVDITSVLLPELQKRFPHYQFQQLDVTRQTLPDSYDLIVMIDVTQHIVSPRRFRRAMKNVWTHLKPGGWFLVTSWLAERPCHRQPHEMARPLSAYQKAFPQAEFQSPVPFRDKYLLAIHKPPGKEHLP